MVDITGQTQNTDDKKITCSNCKSENIIKWCKRKTENRGLIQRYKCKDCGKYFIIDEGFFRKPSKSTLNSEFKFIRYLRLVNKQNLWEKSILNKKAGRK